MYPFMPLDEYQGISHPSLVMGIQGSLHKGLLVSIIRPAMPLNAEGMGFRVSVQS